MIWLMVAIAPMFIITLITSAALIAIFCARSDTEILSGTSTSLTTGATGRSKPCLPDASTFCLRALDFVGLRRPRLSLATCNSLRL